MILFMNGNIFKIDLIPDNTEISISEDETILTASLKMTYNIFMRVVVLECAKLVGLKF